jgi:hypothetical protein
MMGIRKLINDFYWLMTILDLLRLSQDDLCVCVRFFFPKGNSLLGESILLGVLNVTYDQLISSIEGSLEVKLPTIWRDEKQSRAEAERRGRLEERRSEEKE